MKGKLFLIDANSIVHRAYHALPPLTNQAGQPTGALYGLASVLIKLFKERRPEYVAAAFDRPEPTLREQSYKEYKALRPPTPDDLIPQLKMARSLISSFGVRVFDAPGYEADDIIATLASRFKEEVDQVIVLSGDLDTFQVVDGDRVVAEIPQRGVGDAIIYNEQGVINKLGVNPNQIPDYKGLVGDKSDNIPGVTGIGPKTAANLLASYRTLEGIYDHLAAIESKQPQLAAKLQRGSELAFLSKQLATALKNTPTPNTLEELSVPDNLNQPTLRALLDELGFKTLLQRLDSGPASQSPPKGSPPRQMGKLF